MESLGHIFQRSCQLVLFLGLGLLALALIINLFVVLSSRSQVLEGEDFLESSFQLDQSPVLVFGAGVIDNAYPSNILARRLDKAYDVYQVSPRKTFIMSGDHREASYNEVGVMKAYLVDQGVPSQQVYLDHAGYSTFDSLYRLKHVFGVDRAILVTQAYHLPRALMWARNLGIEAIGLAAEDTGSQAWKREGREFLARVKDFFGAYFHWETRQPSHDYPIQLDQSGDQTNQKESLETN